MRKAVESKMEKPLWVDYGLHLMLRGLTPVLLHNPAGSMKSVGGEIERKIIPSPEEEAERGTYRFPDGSLGFPAIGVRASILGGAVGMRMKRGKMGARQALAGMVMLTGDELFPFLSPDGELISTYSIDIRRVDVQGRGILRARARVDLPWLLNCIFVLSVGAEVDAEEFLGSTLRPVMVQAGRVAGIGDWRPAKGGWHGKYDLERIWVTSL